MEDQLKEMYGTRTTVNVKILMLVFVTLLGLHLALNKTNKPEKIQLGRVVVE